MKKYENVEIEVIIFDVKDVITDSDTVTDEG